MADCYFNFVDIGAYGLTRQMSRPNWINVVREPVSRFVSHFYYMSRDWRMQNKVLQPEDAKVRTIFPFLAHCTMNIFGSKSGHL